MSTSDVAVKRTPLRRYGKYRTRLDAAGRAGRTLAGHEYDSALEARYAARLETLRHAVRLSERVLAVRPQVSVPLEVNGHLICRYRVDFVVSYADGREAWVEVKGLMTPEARIKMNLFRALFPERKLEIVRRA